MTTPIDLTALAREWNAREFRGQLSGRLEMIAAKFAEIATLSHTAGRVEGMLEAARIADSCGETRAAQGREARFVSGDEAYCRHFAAAGALRAFATHLRALASSDPAPGDQQPACYHATVEHVSSTESRCTNCGDTVRWGDDGDYHSVDPAPGDHPTKE